MFLNAPSPELIQYGKRFAVDHQLLVSRDNHGDRSAILGNVSVAQCPVHRVALRIEFKTEESKRLDHRGPNRQSGFAYTAVSRGTFQVCVLLADALTLPRSTGLVVS
jgi:hypothetical protein